MRGAFKNDRTLKILNGHEKITEGTSRGDTASNLHNFPSHIFLVPTGNLENVNLEGAGLKTQ